MKIEAFETEGKRLREHVDSSMAQLQLGQWLRDTQEQFLRAQLYQFEAGYIKALKECATALGMDYAELVCELNKMDRK